MKQLPFAIRRLARELLLRSPVASIAGACLSAFNRGPALVVLIYHDVPRTRVGLFRKQIEFLRAHYNIVNPETFLAMLSRERPAAGRHVLITFDDGFASQAEAAESVLEPLGIEALFFVITGFVGTQGEAARNFIAENLMRREAVDGGVPKHLMPMSWEIVKRLDAAGHTVGAHTINHISLPSLTTQEQLEAEIAGSADSITQHTGKQVDFFTYPFGAIDHIDRPSMARIKERYQACFSGVRGGNKPGGDRYAILRETVDLDDAFGSVRFMVEGGMARAYRNKAKRLVEIAS